MEQNKALTARISLGMILNHILVIAFAITLLDVFGVNNRNILLWSVMIIVPFLYAYIRVHLQSMMGFYMIHAIMVLCAFLYPADVPTKFLLLVITIGYTGWSIFIKLKGELFLETVIPVAFGVSLLFVLSFVERLNNNIKSENIYFILVMLYLIVYFLWYFFGQHIHFIDMNERSASNIPQKNIFSHGFYQTLLFCIVSVCVFVVILYIDWFTALFHRIGLVIWGWILALIELLAFENIEESGPQSVLPENLVDVEGAIQGAAGEVFVPKAFIEAISNIVSIGVSILLVLALVGGIVYVLWFVRNHFSVYTQEEEKCIDNNDDIREKCVPKKSQKEKKASFWDSFSNREKTRRIFRKKVLKRKQELIGEREQNQLGYYTAKECCDTLHMDNLKQVYEKARYSKHIVTKEDMQLLRTDRKGE